MEKAKEEIAAMGINRYIVGCKYYTGRVQAGNAERINRYIVGCKCFRQE